MNPYNRFFDPNNPFALNETPTTSPTQPPIIPPMQPGGTPPIQHAMQPYAAYASMLSGMYYPNFPSPDLGRPIMPPRETTPDVVPETQPDTMGQPSASKGKKRSHKKKDTAETVERKTVNVQKWTTEELTTLAKAYIHVSEDPIIGNNQKQQKFWDRISEMFHQTLNREEYRLNDSLSSKWRDLNKKASYFNGLFLNARNNKKSGENEADFLARALADFQAGEKQPFQYLEAWQVLRYSSKWASVPLVTNSSKRSKTSSSTHSDARTEIDLNLSGDDIEPEPARPQGRDKAKRKSSKAPASSYDFSQSIQELSTHLDKFNEIQQGKLEEKRSIRALFQEKVQLKKDKEAAKQKREDLKFLATNFDHLSGPEQQLYEDMKKEIREKYGL